MSSNPVSEIDDIPCMTSPSAPDEWTVADDIVLRNIHRAVSVYVESFYHYNDYLRRLSMRFRIPIIILSAASSGASFGNVSLLPTTQRNVNMIVGCITLFVTILTAIEGYLKLPVLTNQTDKVIMDLGKISHKLYTHLSLHPALRDTPKKIIVETTNDFTTAITNAPIIPASVLARIKAQIQKHSIYSLFAPPVKRYEEPSKVADVIVEMSKSKASKESQLHLSTIYESSHNMTNSYPS